MSRLKKPLCQKQVKNSRFEWTPFVLRAQTQPAKRDKLLWGRKRTTSPDLSGLSFPEPLDQYLTVVDRSASESACNSFQPFPLWKKGLFERNVLRWLFEFQV